MLFLVALLLMSGEQGVNDVQRDARLLGAMFKARYAQAQGDYATAIRHVEACIELAPRDAEIANLKLEILLDVSARTPLDALKKEEELVGFLKEQITQFPEDFRFPKALGVFLVKEPPLAKTRPRESPVPYLERALVLLEGEQEESEFLRRERSDTRYYLGLWHYRRDDFFDAALHFGEVVKLEPDAGWAWYYSARSLEGSHQLRGALAHYTRYLELASTDPVEYETPVPFSVRLLKVLTDPHPDQVKDLLSWLGQQEDAQTLYLKAARRLLSVALYDEGLQVLLGLPEVSRGLVYYRLLALARMSLHQYDTALKELMAAMSATKREETRNFLVEAAIEAALSAGRYDRLIQLYEGYPRTPSSRLKLGLYAAFAESLSGQGSSRWEQLKRKFGDHGLVRTLAVAEKELGFQLVARQNLSQFYMQWEDWGSALTELDKIYDQRPQLLELGDDRAVVAFLLGRVEEAWSQYRKLIELHPDRVDLLNNYGYFLAEKGIALDTAESLLKRAMDLKEDGAYFDSMGWILFKQGRNQEALTFLEKALTFEEGDPEKLEHLGDVYAALGRKDEARRSWSQAMERADRRYLPMLNKLDPAP